MYVDVPYIAALDHAKLIEEPSLSALHHEAARLRDRGLELATLLKVGEPWAEIVDAASRLDVGLIVMGTHGHRRLPRAILGSVAEKVVRLASVPVLTIHGEDNPAETPTVRPPRAK
jgi:nucleotide-binding universal stress UspA family protein